MKKILIASIVLFLAACGGNTNEKKAEHEKLKKEQADINKKIAEYRGNSVRIEMK